jgi:hypothetical protein
VNHYGGYSTTFVRYPSLLLILICHTLSLVTGILECRNNDMICCSVDAVPRPVSHSLDRMGSLCFL